MSEHWASTGGVEGLPSGGVSGGTWEPRACLLNSSLSNGLGQLDPLGFFPGIQKFPAQPGDIPHLAFRGGHGEVAIPKRR